MISTVDQTGHNSQSRDVVMSFSLDTHSKIISIKRWKWVSRINLTDQKQCAEVLPKQVTFTCQDGANERSYYSGFFSSFSLIEIAVSYERL